jgi:ATP-dependent Lhr-like helicase
LQRRGACFFQELVSGTELLRTEIENALRELIAGGWVTGDGFAGLRALVIAPDKTLGTSASKHKDGRPDGMLPVVPPTAGRWSLVPREVAAINQSRPHRNGEAPDRKGAGDSAGSALPLAGARGPDYPPHESGSAARPQEFDWVDLCARQLLRRYGVVFHRMVCPPLGREYGLPPWRELLYRFRRMEARGEIRGGRFVAGFSGEQYALPEAIQQLRATRRKASTGELVIVSAADPLNLAGVVTPGPRIAATAANRILFRDGVPIAAREGGELIELHPSAAALPSEIRARLGK